MASGTISAETAAVFILRSMAGNAARRRLIFPRRGPQMAGCAGKGFMRAGQRKACVLGVVKSHAGPICWGMTSNAVGPEAAVVAVIFLMAIDAFRRGIKIGRGRVAIGAVRVRMGAEQRKGCKIVVKADARSPARNAMARAAPIAKLTFVGIVLSVALDAARARHAEFGRCLMASCAFRALMGPAKGKIRVAGVIEGGLRPAGGRMAVCAIRAQCTLVCIIGAVAANAGGGRGVRLVRPMTCCAFKPRMTA